MRAQVVTAAGTSEFWTEERCLIEELWNHPCDGDVSIARARVEPGVTTELHRLNVDERYLITSGRGRVEVSGLEPHFVSAGDTVLIPSGCEQRICNVGEADLEFLCICTPRFTSSSYQKVES